MYIQDLTGTNSKKPQIKVFNNDSAVIKLLEMEGRNSTVNNTAEEKSRAAHQKNKCKNSTDDNESIITTLFLLLTVCSFSETNDVLSLILALLFLS